MAGTPRRRISGCAQWWPARIATRLAVAELGEVVRVDALDREAHEAAALGGVGGPVDGHARRPRESRSSAYAVSSRSCARTASIPRSVR